MTDTVNFTVTSDDDCSNDDSCNQLASYDGYGVMSIDMVVVDDDFAHIILHGNASLSATIDNYGDALMTPMYAVSLNSEPTGDVTMEVVGPCR